MKIHQGSILDVTADAIVNPANQWLRHGAGLARIIADGAAPKNTPGPSGDQREPNRCDAVGRAWWAEQYSHSLIPVGGAGVTSAGHLPFKAVIHAVGPVWGGGRYCEPSLLKSAHADAFALAVTAGHKSIAVPAISCGLFGYPVALAAPIAVSSARATEILFDLDITFALMEDEHVRAYSAAIEALPC